MVKINYNENIKNYAYRYYDKWEKGEEVDGSGLFERAGTQNTLLCFDVGGAPIPSCGGDAGLVCPDGLVCNIVELQTQGGTAAAGIGSIPRGCCRRGATASPTQDGGSDGSVSGEFPDGSSYTFTNTPLTNLSQLNSFISARSIETVWKDSTGTKTLELDLPGFVSMGITESKLVSSQTSKIVDSTTKETTWSIQDGSINNVR